MEAQRRFYAYDHLKELRQLVAKAEAPEKISRLIQVYQDTLGYRIVQEAETAKIALGVEAHHTAQINLKAELLDIPISQAQMEEAIEFPLRSITQLVQESIRQAGTQPDVVYITGGSAQSPILRQALKAVLPDTPIASGDFDGSVTYGLARWAKVCFRLSSR